MNDEEPIKNFILRDYLKKVASQKEDRYQKTARYVEKRRREEALRLKKGGLSEDEIASILGVSERKVLEYISEDLQKPENSDKVDDEESQADKDDKKEKQSSHIGQRLSHKRVQELVNDRLDRIKSSADKGASFSEIAKAEKLTDDQLLEIIIQNGLIKKFPDVIDTFRKQATQRSTESESRQEQPSKMEKQQELTDEERQSLGDKSTEEDIRRRKKVLLKLYDGIPISKIYSSYQDISADTIKKDLRYLIQLGVFNDEKIEEIKRQLGQDKETKTKTRTRTDDDGDER